MPRLFTGIEIPPEIGLALSAYRGGLPGARWIDPENYHITLRFIGDIDERMADDVCSILGDSRWREPITVTIEGLDTFGGGKPRAVFARATGNGELADLQAEQERMMRQIGLAPETRKFIPHVTLARLKNVSPIDVADYMAARGHFAKLTFTFDRFVLYSSRASVGGGPYVIEAAYPLG
ncbi:RNA 2',3'-cyclic phosphodiesterase [Microvirga makkahensis]|uniref:RNA 2',3'-cyclic phosphodiesterase n=1 Tax=Microvirga makkahensis TaxID=1128670 RepID=A0A7X3MUQ1_9HYPH|nr:RNA 2',3'-cyclic phosphodiesterase [Microvirga makkahensis]MXQ13408.1 RNA 2',3'-cyclic phosphodiesterase [Microvirga makkahensis]